MIRAAVLNPVVERQLTAFEAAVRSSPRAPFTDYLLPPDNADYQRVAIELMRVDLELAWQRGEPRRVEDYRVLVPHLLDNVEFRSDLAFEEFRNQVEHGEEVDASEYVTNYGVDTTNWIEVTSAPQTHNDVGDANQNAAPSTPAQLPKPGDAWGEFEILDELGRGSLARTYLAAFADISSIAELDTFEHSIVENYSGNLTVQVITTGISQLAPSLQVHDQSGTLQGSSVGQAMAGEDLSDTFSVDTTVTDLVLEISSIQSDASGIGGYSVVIIYDQLNQVSPASVNALVREPLRLVEVDDLEEYFEDGDQLFANDDHGSNDLAGSEVELETAPGFVDGTRFQTTASIETVGDIDRYRVVSPNSTAPPSNAAIIGLHSTSIGAFTGQLHVYDQSGALVPSTVVVHNDYQLLVQLLTVGSEETYIIEIEAVENSNEPVGSYELVAQFGTVPVERETFLGGRMATAFSPQAHNLRVNRPQLFHFGLRASSAADNDAIIELTIRNAAGDVVLRINTQVGDTQTQSVLLSEGRYSIRVQTSQLGTTWSPVDYTLVGAAVDDPLGPRLNDTTDDPYDFDEGPRKFFVVTFFSF